MKQIKTIKGLAKELCARERKKKQVDIAQMSETLAQLSDVVHIHRIDIYMILASNGHKRAQKRARQCRK